MIDAPDLSWLQAVSAAGFAGLAWFLIARAIPQMLAAFRAELAQERELREKQSREFVEALRQERIGYRQDLESFKVTLERWSARQDALVREMFDRLDGDGEVPEREGHGG